MHFFHGNRMSTLYTNSSFWWRTVDVVYWCFSVGLFYVHIYFHEPTYFFVFFLLFRLFPFSWWRSNIYTCVNNIYTSVYNSQNLKLLLVHAVVNCRCLSVVRFNIFIKVVMGDPWTANRVPIILIKLVYFRQMVNGTSAESSSIGVSRFIAGNELSTIVKYEIYVSHGLFIHVQRSPKSKSESSTTFLNRGTVPLLKLDGDNTSDKWILFDHCPSLSHLDR